MVDIEVRSVTTYVFWCYVCFCNFRLLLLYVKFTKNASVMTKITTLAIGIYVPLPWRVGDLHVTCLFAILDFSFGLRITALMRA